MRKRWWALGLMGGVVGLAAVALYAASGVRPSGAEVLPPKGDTTKRPPPERVRMLSWNVHYGAGPTLDQGRATSRAEMMRYLEQIADLIRASDADIVALQEVDRDALRSHGLDQLEWLRDATGLPHAAWTDTWDAGWVPYPGLRPGHQIGRVWSGQAVLSRYPLRTARRHDLPQPAANGRIYNLFYLHRALLDVVADLGDGRSLRVINAHLEAFDVENKAFQAALVRDLLDSDQTLTVLAGDMNSVPPEAALRHAFPDEPETDMRGDDTIDNLRSISGLQELVPSATYTEREASWFTFPANAPNRRLDYIFYDTRLQLVSARVPPSADPPSDHLPVIAELQLPASAGSTPRDNPT